MKKKIAAIYKIINKLDGKLYIGSAIDLYNRWRIHKQDLNNKVHHSAHLQHAWDKYGKDNFTFEVIEIIENPTKELLEQKEQYWLDFYQSYNSAIGYNICQKAGTSLGYKHTEESRKIISEKAKKRDHTEMTSRLLNSEGCKLRWEKFIWKQILNQYKDNINELKELLRSTTYIELSEKFNCSVDAIYTLRKRLKIDLKRTDVDEFLKQYSKEQLEDLYFDKYDRHLKDMAEGLDIYQDTLSKIFEKLGIIQQPHHVSEYPEVRQILSDKAKKRAKIKNPILNILKDPSWRAKSDATRVANGSMKRLKSKYRWLEEMDIKELVLRVQNSDISKVARELNVTRAVLDGHLKRNEAYLNEQKVIKNASL